MIVLALRVTAPERGVPEALGGAVVTVSYEAFEANYGVVAVLDDGRLIGIITETDIVRAFVRATAPAGGFKP